MPKYIDKILIELLENVLMAPKCAKHCKNGILFKYFGALVHWKG